MTDKYYVHIVGSRAYKPYYEVTEADFDKIGKARERHLTRALSKLYAKMADERDNIVSQIEDKLAELESDLDEIRYADLTDQSVDFCDDLQYNPCANVGPMFDDTRMKELQDAELMLTSELSELYSTKNYITILAVNDGDVWLTSYAKRTKLTTIFELAELS